jgi:hypothetical protein
MRRVRASRRKRNVCHVGDIRFGGAQRCNVLVRCFKTHACGELPAGRHHEGTVRVWSSEQTGRSGTVYSLFFPVEGSGLA